MAHATRPIGLPRALLLVALLTLTIASASCRKPLATQVRDLLARGEVDKALAAAEAAPERAKVAVAEVFYRWAKEQRTATTPTDPVTLFRVYLSAATLDPTHVPYYTALAEALPIDWFQLEPVEPHADAVKAYDLWHAAAQSHPDLATDPDFRRAGSVLAKAVRSYREAADLNPRDPDAQVLAARDCLASGDRAQALLYVQAAAAIAPGHPAISGLLAKLQALEESGPAAQALDREMLAAIDRLIAGDHEAAILHARRASELAPDRPDVLCLLAELGLVDPLPTDVVIQGPLPRRPDTQNALQARGDWVVVIGADRGDPCVSCYGLSRADLSLQWRLDDCRGENACLSPSGRYLSYTTGPYGYAQPRDVLVYDTATGESHAALSGVVDVWGTSWSPDERSIAVSTAEGLIVVARDGTGRQLLDRAEYQDEWLIRRVINPFWFAGGAEIGGQDRGLDSVDQLWAFDPLSGARRKVDLTQPEPWGNVRWSPDGSHVALPLLWWDDPRGILVGATAPGAVNEGTVIVERSYVWALPVAWSPDGQRLLLSLNLRPPDATGSPEVYRQLWVWDRSDGRFSLLVAGRQIHRAIWGDDGVIYYAESEPRRLTGLRLRP